MLCDESRNLFQRIHNVLRSQATELLVFMINNKDRLQTDDVLNSMPLGYALKGRCLSNADLHHLINTVRNKLKEHKIDILVECCNGQWQLTVMTTEKGEPLNEMQVAQAT